MPARACTQRKQSLHFVRGCNWVHAGTQTIQHGSYKRKQKVTWSPSALPPKIITITASRRNIHRPCVFSAKYCWRIQVVTEPVLRSGAKASRVRPPPPAGFVCFFCFVGAKYEGRTHFQQDSFPAGVSKWYGSGLKIQRASIAGSIPAACIFLFSYFRPAITATPTNAARSGDHRRCAATAPATMVLHRCCVLYPMSATPIAPSTVKPS
jgi:hypothetical protein